MEVSRARRRSTRRSQHRPARLHTSPLSSSLWNISTPVTVVLVVFRSPTISTSSPGLTRLQATSGAARWVESRGEGGSG
eukprot:scaffold18052_cov28-Tisochrysis_lutea.AAC.3